MKCRMNQSQRGMNPTNVILQRGINIIPEIPLKNLTTIQFDSSHMKQKVEDEKDSVRSVHRSNICQHAFNYWGFRLDLFLCVSRTNEKVSRGRNRFPLYIDAHLFNSLLSLTKNVSPFSSHPRVALHALTLIRWPINSSVNDTFAPLPSRKQDIIEINGTQILGENRCSGSQGPHCIFDLADIITV